MYIIFLINGLRFWDMFGCILDPDYAKRMVYVGTDGLQSKFKYPFKVEGSPSSTQMTKGL